MPKLAAPLDHHGLKTPIPLADDKRPKARW